jgi:hypothetical protein
MIGHHRGLRIYSRGRTSEVRTAGADRRVERPRASIDYIFWNNSVAELGRYKLPLTVTDQDAAECFAPELGRPRWVAAADHLHT